MSALAQGHAVTLLVDEHTAWWLLLADSVHIILALLREHLGGEERRVESEELYEQLNVSLDDLRAHGVELACSTSAYCATWRTAGYLVRSPAETNRGGRSSCRRRRLRRSNCSITSSSRGSRRRNLAGRASRRSSASSRSTRIPASAPGSPDSTNSTIRSMPRATRVCAARHRRLIVTGRPSERTRVSHSRRLRVRVLPHRTPLYAATTARDAKNLDAANGGRRH